MKSVLAQSLRRHVAGRAAAQDHECSFILSRITPGHRRNATVYRFIGQGGDNALAFDPDLVARQRIERGRLEQITRPYVE